MSLVTGLVWGLFIVLAGAASLTVFALYLMRYRGGQRGSDSLGL